MDLLHVMLMMTAVAVTASRSFAIPQTDEHKNRVIDRVCICPFFVISVIDRVCTRILTRQAVLESIDYRPIRS